MAKQYIKIRGANEHNLKNVSLDIPRNELVVLTGLSDRVNHHWLLIRFMRKGRDGTWSPSPPTQGSSGPDGEAGCGEHRGAFPGHLH